MLHFLQRVASTANQKAAKEPPIIPVIAWLATECLCLGLPWVAYPMAGLGSFAAAFAPAIVWKTLWPVLVGVGLFIGLRRWPPRLPSIPSGDIVALGEGVARRSHLRSRDRQTRRHPEVMDCCMPHASSNCPPTRPHDGGWRLTSPPYWFSVLHESAMLLPTRRDNLLALTSRFSELCRCAPACITLPCGFSFVGPDC
jgi:hypothetical protein